MGKKILIVDDEADFVTLIKTRLEVNSFEVVTAGNGDEGLEKVKSEKPDLVLLDIQMPKMDGYTFLLELKKFTDLKTTPVIILSAKGQLQDIFKMEGIQDYFVKPINDKDLLEKIKKYLP